MKRRGAPGRGRVREPRRICADCAARRPHPRGERFDSQAWHLAELRYLETSDECSAGVHFLTAPNPLNPEPREICVPREDIYSHDREARSLLVMCREPAQVH